MRFVYEVEFELGWDPWFPVTFAPSHPQARVEHVHARAERDARGKVTRWVGVLTIKDGDDSNRRPEPRQVIVARRAGRITEIPDWADKLIGRFASDHGETEWYVYSAREEPAHREARPQSAALPAPQAADSGRAAPARRQPSSPPPALQTPPAQAQAASADSWLSGLS